MLLNSKWNRKTKERWLFKQVRIEGRFLLQRRAAEACNFAVLALVNSPFYTQSFPRGVPVLAGLRQPFKSSYNSSYRIVRLTPWSARHQFYPRCAPSNFVPKFVSFLARLFSSAFASLACLRALYIVTLRQFVGVNPLSLSTAHIQHLRAVASS